MRSIEREEGDRLLHFQAFERCVHGRSGPPEGTDHIHVGNSEGDLDADGKPRAVTIGMVAEAVGKNENGQSYFSVGYLPGARQADIEAPRRETPKWMFNDGKFREFLQSRNRRIERWTVSSWPRITSIENRMKRFSEDTKSNYTRRGLGRRGETKEALDEQHNALTKRRIRLVEDGDRMYPDLVTNSDVAETAAGDPGMP